MKFTNLWIKQIVPVVSDNFELIPLNCYQEGAVEGLLVHPVGHVLQEVEDLLARPEHGVLQNGRRRRSVRVLHRDHLLDQRPRGRPALVGHLVQVVLARQDVGLPPEAFSERMRSVGEDEVVDAAEGEDVDGAGGRAVAQHHLWRDPAFSSRYSRPPREGHAANL